MECPEIERWAAMCEGGRDSHSGDLENAEDSTMKGRKGRPMFGGA